MGCERLGVDEYRALVESGSNPKDAGGGVRGYDDPGGCDCCECVPGGSCEAGWGPWTLDGGGEFCVRLGCSRSCDGCGCFCVDQLTDFSFDLGLCA